MVQNDRSKRKIIIISVIALAVVAAAVICIVFARQGYLATTMRLLHVEGTVNIENSKGGSKPVVDNLRFQSGDALSTGADGLASVGLDDAKIITLDHESRAEFKKKKKQLELKLTKGAVFFNVTEKLRPDETFEIKTSTMTAGIRGTSGVVYYDNTDNNRETIAVTDGTVEISATNPDTNETRTARVEAGKQLKVYLFSDKPGESVQFEIIELSEDDLARFTLGLISNDDALINKICNHTGWDPKKLKDVLSGLLKPSSNGNPEPENPENPDNPEKDPDPQPDPQPPKTEDPGTPEDPPSNTNTPAPKSTKNNKKKKTTKKTTKKSTKKKKKKKKSSSTVNPPSGYEKGFLWDSSNKKYIAEKSETNPDSDAPEYKAYVSGKWVPLYVNEREICGGMMVYYYYLDSKENEHIYYSYTLR